jgi:plasmid replication initiation protein
MNTKVPGIGNKDAFRNMFHQSIEKIIRNETLEFISDVLFRFIGHTWPHNSNRIRTLAFRENIGREMRLHEANEGGQAKVTTGIG